MDMTGQHSIAASRREVWAALNDPAVLKRCIPGCQDLDRRSETEFTAKVTARVGPVKASFTGAVTLSDLDPPNGYTIAGEGKGGPAGFARGGARVQLEDDGEGGTLLRYEVEAQVGGKLAQIGSRLIDSTARKMANDFFAGFAEAVAARAPDDAGEPAEGGDSGSDGTAAAPASQQQEAETMSSESSESSDRPAHVPAENVYPRTHWTVWISGAIALATLIAFLNTLF